MATIATSAAPSAASRRSRRSRSVDEVRRTATPLELLFDLTFVAAVAQLVSSFSHETASGHAVSALGPFLMVFFAIWWAWMNATWLSSAYDDDDTAHRAAAFVQMAGVLVLAAGTSRAVEDGDYVVVTAGYLIMRVGLVYLWLRAAVHHPDGRSTCLRYVVGLTVLQVLWIARLALGDRGATATFLVLAGLELAVPMWAERRGSTPWHPHHISERYGLFTLLLLGESVLATATAIGPVADRAVGLDLGVVSVVGLAVVAAVWWLYFSTPGGGALTRRRERSYVWGYGHYVLFASLAALGSGLEVVAHATVEDDPVLSVASLAVTVAAPLGLALVTIRWLQAVISGDRGRGGLARLRCRVHTGQRRP